MKATGFVLLIALTGAARAAEPVVRARWLMGTLCEARAPGGGPAVAPALDAALDRIAALEAVMTTWRPEGELARLNAACAASAGRYPVSRDLARVLAVARQWSERTAGAFDVTVGALADAWGLRSGGRQPSPRELATALAHTGWRRFDVALDDGAVRCERGVQFDLGAIGKGFALDEAAAVLRARGVSRALLDFGGQVLALAAPPGSAAWAIDLSDPEDRDGALLALALADRSVATSSNIERSIDAGGARHGHILDPRTGRPVDRRYAVSVIAPAATDADALSTALFAAGPERVTLPEGIDFIAVEGAGASRSARCSAGFARYADGAAARVACTVQAASR